MGIQKKNSDIDELETHLGILGSNIRIRTLKYLAQNPDGEDFTNIYSEIASFSSENPNLSFHLNKLRDFDYISKTGKLYQLTSFGQRCLENLDKLSEIVLETAPIQIRTSRYTLEPFDERVIAERLMIEANMPAIVADEIAQKAKERLLKSRITYLTSPLIREFINAILIESQYEDFRHKLTRLGVPPYDIHQILKNKTLSNIGELRLRLGKKTIEQYVLLNNLSQKSADGYLSGRFLLTDLESFGFSPLELFISGEHLWSAIENYYQGHLQKTPIFPHQNLDLHDLGFFEFCKVVKHLINRIRPFFSEGLTIFRFDEFLERFLSIYEGEDLTQILFDVFSPRESNWPIKLGLSLQANYTDIDPLLDVYLKSLTYPPSIWTYLPHLQIHFTKPACQDFSNITATSRYNPIFEKIMELTFKHHVSIDQSLARGNPQTEQFFSNLNVPIDLPPSSTHMPGIIVEKISLNIYELYLDLKKVQKYTEKNLLINLESALFSVFNYYEEKYSFLSKNLHNLQNWSIISQLFFNHSDPFSNWSEFSKYEGEVPLYNAVSFHGLNELIYAESGFFIKEIKQSRDLTVRIYDFIDKLLKKQNKSQKSTIKFILSESHYQEELIHPKSDILSDMYKQSERSSEISPTGYKIGLYTNENELKTENVLKIFGDLTNMKYPYLSLSLNLKNGEPASSLLTRVQIVQDLFSIGICNISFNRKLPGYRRYHQKYFSFLKPL